jgi:HEAT repeat protein
MKLFPQHCRKKKYYLYLMTFIVVGLSFLERFTCAGLFGTDVKKLKETRNVQGLILALKDKDPKVQYDAAEALGEIGDNRAVEPLTTALKNDEFSGVRWKAAEALSKIGAPAVEALIGALRHDDDDVRWKAAIALGEIGDPRAIEPLIILLCDEDRFVKSHAALALGAIGEPAVNPLLRALREGDGNLRWGAAIALGKIRDPRAIEPLIRALADKYENVRAESASSLAAIGKPALGPLLRFLKFSDGPERLEVVTTLGELHDTDAIQPLIQMLENADDDERKAIADALDAILIPTTEPLVRKLRDGPHQTNELTRSDNNGGEG